MIYRYITWPPTSTIVLAPAGDRHADGNVSPTWMERVTEAVGVARNAGLYLVLNTHHEQRSRNVCPVRAPSACKQNSHVVFKT